MTFIELVTFIRENWPTIVGVMVVVAPVFAAVFAWLYRNRLDETLSIQRGLEAQVKTLTNERSLEREGGHSSPRAGATVSDVARLPALTDTGIQAYWPKTNDESQENLLGLLRNAKERITVFGLTRNFYVSEEIRPLVLAKSGQVPVVFFMMAPDCQSRTDRYRIEPIEAALEDPSRYRREIEEPFLDMLRTSARTEAGSRNPGLAVYYYNFPCSFAIEEIDDHLRVMLYGHGKRGTEGPILLLHSSSPLASYFQSQLRWLEKLATQGAVPPWRDKGIVVTQLEVAGGLSNKASQPTPPSAVPSARKECSPRRG